ncbi:MAG: hypothetical protein AB1775_04095 [Bacteroidota bacterium]
MKMETRTILIQIVVPTICFILMGIFFIGTPIIIPNNTLFSFTVFGFAAVLFYALLKHLGSRTFVLIGLLFAILALIILEPTTDMLINLRNFNWFVFIGIMIWLISILEKKNWYTRSWIAATWMIGFVCVYALMTILNLYIYQVYRTNEVFTFFFYLKHAAKIGIVLGIGIGIGNIFLRELNSSKK